MYGSPYNIKFYHGSQLKSRVSTMSHPFLTFIYTLIHIIIGQIACNLAKDVLLYIQKYSA